MIIEWFVLRCEMFMRMLHENIEWFVWRYDEVKEMWFV
jgi:hypothetical protein